MRNKRGNVTIALVMAMIVTMSAAAMLVMITSDRGLGNDYQERFEKRTLAESCVDLSIGFFRNSLENKTYTLPYKEIGGGWYRLDDAPIYLFDELASADETVQSCSIASINTACRTYMSNIHSGWDAGCSVDFMVNTMYTSGTYKITNIVTKDSQFQLSDRTDGAEVTETLPSIPVTVRIEYPGGEVLADAEISGIKIKRTSFTVSASGTVTAQIDTSGMTVRYTNYQNYRESR